MIIIMANMLMEEFNKEYASSILAWMASLQEFVVNLQEGGKLADV